MRKGEESDLDDMLRLLGILFSVEQDFSFDETKQRQGLKMLLDEPDNCCIMVAEHEHRVIGMCTAQILISTAEGGRSALLEDVVVEEAYRKQGIGKDLLEGMEKWAVARGAKRCQLLADQDNGNALIFYEKSGWQVTHMINLRKNF